MSDFFGSFALVAALFLAAAGLWLLFTYNTLVALRQRCRQSTADIDVQLHQRLDLVPNLVETVKGYAAHERETLDAVIRARNAAASGGAATGQSILDGALGRLMALAEDYPELKADANFRSLQDELADIEERIAAARRFLNNAVAEYNTMLEAFPAVLVARPLGFSPEAFYEPGVARASLTEAPAVTFKV